MNIAIFSPSKNPYSETFIQAHKNFLKGNIFYYYGIGSIKLEDYPPLGSKLSRIYYKIFEKIFKKPANYANYKLIEKSLAQYKIDVVLIEYGTHAHSLLPVIKKVGIPLVVHFHGYDASVIEVIKKHNSYKEVFHYANKVIAVSKKMEEMLLSLGCPREKLIYNVYGPHPEFEKIKPTYKKPQFLAVGRFTDKKAPYYTILSFYKVLKNNLDVKLIMAGDGQLLNTCKNLVKYLKIESNVQFLGVISPQQYRELLSESIGFIQHSITAENGDMEGTPLSILEASAAGLPIVSTFHAGISDVIKHTETGLLCNEHNVDDMMQNIIELVENPILAKTLGAKGKENIKNNFSMQKHIDSLQKILSDAIEN